MNAELVALLRCPTCHGSLAVSTDRLSCTGCGRTFPIVGQVPRFAGESYVASFGRQWNRFDVARDEEDRAVFQTKTGIAPESLRGKLVLDAGCGGGRYTRLLGMHGAQVIGIDLSAAVEKAAALCADLPNVLIVQADLFALPLAEACFDLAFSIGVMHHSPDPKRAFMEVAQRVRKGGRLAVWLYRRNSPPQEWMNSALRAVTCRLPTRLLELGCVGLGVLGGIPVANKILNKIANFSNHPDWTLRVCDNFDWYAPRYQSHHTEDELRAWFMEAGFTDLTDLPPARSGSLYNWTYRHNLIIGSGVNVAGTRMPI